jgi:cbb3-type cytochrome oxidase maturation protein
VRPGKSLKAGKSGLHHNVMLVVALLIFISLALALAFLGGFIWAVRSGQYEDTFTPSMRILTDDHTQHPKPLKHTLSQPKS